MTNKELKITATKVRKESLKQFTALSPDIRADHFPQQICSHISILKR